MSRRAVTIGGNYSRSPQLVSIAKGGLHETKAVMVSCLPVQVHGGIRTWRARAMTGRGRARQSACGVSDHVQFGDMLRAVWFVSLTESESRTRGTTRLR